MTENMSTELVLSDEKITATDMVAAFNNPNNSVFSTIKTETFSDKLRVLESVTNATPIRDHLDKPIALTGWTAQVVELTDEKTGAVSQNVRLVLMDASGKAYSCVSGGIYKSLSNFQMVLGDPNEWEEPVKVKAVEKNGKGMNRFLTLTLA